MLKAHDAVLSAREATLDHRRPQDPRSGEHGCAAGRNRHGDRPQWRGQIHAGALHAGPAAAHLGADHPPSWPARRLCAAALSAHANVPLDVRRLLSLTIKADRSRRSKRPCARRALPTSKAASVTRLSGGELQRALLARALLRKPELLVLDEPVQAVDFMGEARMYELISEIRKTPWLRYPHGQPRSSHGHGRERPCRSASTGMSAAKARPPRCSRTRNSRELFGPSAARMIAAYTHHHDHDHESHDHHHHHHDHRH